MRLLFIYMPMIYRWSLIVQVPKSDRWFRSCWIVSGWVRICAQLSFALFGGGCGGYTIGVVLTWWVFVQLYPSWGNREYCVKGSNHCWCEPVLGTALFVRRLQTLCKWAYSVDSDMMASYLNVATMYVFHVFEGVVELAPFSKALMICVNSLSCWGVAVISRVLMRYRLRYRSVSVTLPMVCSLCMTASIHPSRLD